MHTFLGLLGVAVFIPCIITLAAAITWAVVKITPTPDGDDASKTSRASSS